MEDFTLEKIKDYKLFYVLKNIKSTSRTIVLSHRQTLTNAVVEKEKYDLFRIGQDKVLVAFKSAFQHIGKHNYVASNGLEEENIVLQSYERIHDYYKTDTDDSQSGVFVFIDSRPIVLEGQDWRCDNSLYGARIFYAIGQDEVPVFNGHAKIKVYEPILSINGIGYITYVKHGGDDTDIRFSYINDALLPQSGESFSEIIKLILEWAAVAVPPFENMEEIARKAKQFVERFGITEELVSGQPDMQVAKYLKGEPTARLRTEGSYPLTEQQDDFIKNHMCYMTFSKIAQMHPDCFNLEQVVAFEKEHLIEEWNEALLKYHINETKEYGDVAGVYQYLTENLPDTVDFVGLFFNLLNKKKELLEGIA